MPTYFKLIACLVTVFLLTACPGPNHQKPSFVETGTSSGTLEMVAPSLGELLLYWAAVSSPAEVESYDALAPSNPTGAIPSSGTEVETSRGDDADYLFRRASSTTVATYVDPGGSASELVAGPVVTIPSGISSAAFTSIDHLGTRTKGYVLAPRPSPGLAYVTCFGPAMSCEYNQYYFTYGA